MIRPRYSKQRDCIMQDLQGRHDHPTAEMVYESVKKVLPNISLGTVYRNLAQLSASGEIMKITCDDDKVHYDGNPSTHYHLLCVDCKCIYDLDIPTMPALDYMANQSSGGEIFNHDIIFKGRCSKCSEINRNTQK